MSPNLAHPLMDLDLNLVVTLHLGKLIVKGKGTKWFIEGDISAYFNKIDHTILLNIIRENFQDNRFINLISMLLKAGYLEDWKFNATLSGCTRFSYWSDF
jgi:hypothetical protein